MVGFKFNYFCFINEFDYYIIKEMLFLYWIRDEMIKRKKWIILDSINLTEEKINEYKRKAKFFGEYRYDKDNGWIGVYAQEIFCEYLKKNNINFEKWEEVTQIDEYDIKIGKIKIDVKCATQSNYLEMTPKVLVEDKNKKDYYVALKYFEDINKLVIVGYFEHEDLWGYPFKVLYGTPFWGVKLYNAKPFLHLLETIINNNKI